MFFIPSYLTQSLINCLQYPVDNQTNAYRGTSENTTDLFFALPECFLCPFAFGDVLKESKQPAVCYIYFSYSVNMTKITFCSYNFQFKIIRLTKLNCPLYCIFNYRF